MKNIHAAIGTHKIIGDLSDEAIARSKEVISLEVSLGEKGCVSFQIAPSNILIISNSDNEKLGKARSYLRKVIVAEEWQIKKDESKEEKYLNSIDEQKIKEALEELRWLFECHFPPIEFIASHPDVRMLPEQILNILYSLGWHNLSKEEEKKFELQFQFRAEQAWQYKNEIDKLWLSPDETARRKFEKRITRFLEIYPNEVRNPNERGV